MILTLEYINKESWCNKNKKKKTNKIIDHISIYMEFYTAVVAAAAASESINFLFSLVIWMWCGHSNKSLSWYVDFELLNENQKCFFFWPFYPWVGGFWDFHLNSESNEWTSFSHTHQSNEFGKFLFWHWWKLIECWFCIFVLFLLMMTFSREYRINLKKK